MSSGVATVVAFSAGLSPLVTVAPFTLAVGVGVLDLPTTRPPSTGSQPTWLPIRTLSTSHHHSNDAVVVVEPDLHLRSCRPPAGSRSLAAHGRRRPAAARGPGRAAVDAQVDVGPVSAELL